jgi:hypothetical protein
MHRRTFLLGLFGVTTAAVANGPRMVRWATDAATRAGNRSAAGTGGGCGAVPSVPARCEGKPKR